MTILYICRDTQKILLNYDGENVFVFFFKCFPLLKDRNPQLKGIFFFPMNILDYMSLHTFTGKQITCHGFKAQRNIAKWTCIIPSFIFVTDSGSGMSEVAKQLQQQDQVNYV